MKKFLIAATGIFLLSIVSFVTAASEDDFNAKCKAWATEDGISEDNMASYLEECVAQLKAESQEMSGEQPADSGDDQAKSSDSGS